jgi:hypothetical protein
MSRTVRHPESSVSAFAINARLRPASPAKFASSASISVSKLCNREVRAAPRFQIFSELMSRKVGSWESLSASLRSPCGLCFFVQGRRGSAPFLIPRFWPGRATRSPAGSLFSIPFTVRFALVHTVFPPVSSRDKSTTPPAFPSGELLW